MDLASRPQPPTCGGLRPALCSVFARGGFKFLSLSFSPCVAHPPPTLPATPTTTHRPEWLPPPHFNKPFHRGQFSFLHAVSWGLLIPLPSSPSRRPLPPLLTGMCSAPRCLLAGAFRGVSVSPRQLLAPCASLSGGWPTARRPLPCTPPAASPRGRSPPWPPSLGLGWNNGALHRISGNSLM